LSAAQEILAAEIFYEPVDINPPRCGIKAWFILHIIFESPMIRCANSRRSSWCSIIFCQCLPA